MTGVNTTEMGCLMPMFFEEMTPGLEAGWTEIQLLENYQQTAKAMGEDSSKIPELVETLKTIYAANRDMSGEQEYSRLHQLYSGDLVFLGGRHRIEQICNDQPVFHYELNVRTKAFHEEPYKNGATKVRKEFCRSDHGDDLLYMFGMMFDPEYKLPHGRYFSDEEKNLSRRMMKGI